MRLPPLLRPGDRVRVIAPSGAFDRAAFDAGLAILRAADLQPVYDEGLFAKARYLAGSDQRRLQELNAALADPAAKALWYARGGYGSTRLLPMLEAAAVKRAGKWLIGFSDATALHLLWQRQELVSLHAANVTTLPGWQSEARRELFDCLIHGRMPALSGRGLHGKTSVRGRLIGGNLTVMAALCGTDFAPRCDGAVVLLEDVGERPYRLDRSLTQLKMAGVFAGAVGIAIGQLTDCKEKDPADYTALEVVFDTLVELGLPIVSDLPVGHEDSSHPLLLGADVILDPRAGTLAPA